MITVMGVVLIRLVMDPEVVVCCAEFFCVVCVLFVDRIVRQKCCFAPYH